MPKVIIREGDYQNLNPIIKEIFDVFPLELENKKVLIKPNLVSPEPPDKALTTHPSIIRAIAEEVQRRGGEPWVGDNGLDVDTLYEKTGIQDVCATYTKNISDRAEMCQVGRYGVPISKALFEADVFINVPKLKTHVLAGMTCCMKNVFGLIPGNFKARMHALSGHAKRLTEFFVDLYGRRIPDLNIVDGIIAMEGNGPSHGSPRHVGKIIAGDDGIAVDSICARIIGFENPTNIKTIDLATRKGLAPADLSNVDVDGPLDVVEGFLHPSTYAVHRPGEKSSFAGSHEEYYRLWNELGTVLLDCDEAKCTECGDCVEICPTEAISLEPYPIIDAGKCLSCFCCAEGCQEKSLFIAVSEELREKRKRLGM